MTVYQANENYRDHGVSGRSCIPVLTVETKENQRYLICCMHWNGLFCYSILF